MSGTSYYAYTKTVVYIDAFLFLEAPLSLRLLFVPLAGLMTTLRLSASLRVSRRRLKTRANMSLTSLSSRV